MHIISIDVGIKNLSYCLFNVENETNNISILKWGIVNLVDGDSFKCGAIDPPKKKNASTLNNENKDATENIICPCGKPAKYVLKQKYYCLQHIKKLHLLVPIDLESKKIKCLDSIPDLQSLCGKYNIDYSFIGNKKEFHKKIIDFCEDQFATDIPKTKSASVNLVTIGRNIQDRFDILLGDHIYTLDKVIIENQIGPLAIKMKTIQGMLAQYFIMKNNNISIDFISSTNKLKDFIGKEKLDYNKRKKLGINVCLDFVTTDERFIAWLDVFKSHPKKDDLADAFLQGMWFIKHKI